MLGTVLKVILGQEEEEGHVVVVIDKFSFEFSFVSCTATYLVMRQS